MGTEVTFAPFSASRYVAPYERVLGNVSFDPADHESCWLFMGARNSYGYGVISVRRTGRARDRSMQGAHRAVYEALVEPIAAELTLDHLCRVRHCVNPTHLEPCSRGENVKRGESISSAYARRSCCSKGHELDAGNIYRNPAAPQARVCRTCAKEYRSRYYAEHGK